jgi:NitT/TauT family transport system substrate-binding protein
MNKYIIVAAIALIVVVVVGGLYVTGAFNQSQPQTTTNTTITFGLLLGDLHHLSFNVAEAEGYYAQNGINVTTNYYVNGPALMKDFLAGNLDFAIVGVVPAMTYRANGMSSSNATTLPILIGSANQEGSALVVNSNKIDSIADLNGTTIGTPGAGTIQDILLTIFESENNITVVKDPMPNGNLPVAFNNGEIDGFISWEPTPSEVLASNPNATVLVTSGDIIANHQCCVLIVSDKYLAVHPDIVSKVVQIQNEAMSFMNTNPTVAIAVGVNSTGLSEPVINAAFHDISFNQTVNVASLQTFLSYMIKFGVITTINQSQISSFMSGFIDSTYVH